MAILGAFQAMWSLLARLFGMFGPLTAMLGSLVTQFGGFVSGCVAFPFHMLFQLLSPFVSALRVLYRLLVSIAYELGNVVGFVRRMLGLGAPAVTVMESQFTVLQSMQNLWTQVLRPIKAVIKSVYDSCMMAVTKILKHRLSSERWVGDKRSKSGPITRALLSNTALVLAGGTIVLLALESVLAELIGATLTASALYVCWARIATDRAPAAAPAPAPATLEEALQAAATRGREKID